MSSKFGDEFLFPFPDPPSLFLLLTKMRMTIKMSMGNIAKGHELFSDDFCTIEPSKFPARTSKMALVPLSRPS